MSAFLCRPSFVSLHSEAKNSSSFLASPCQGEAAVRLRAAGEGPNFKMSSCALPSRANLSADFCVILKSMIFHILNHSEWEVALSRGRYAAASLHVEGFIHCSTLAQVVDTANRFYHRQAGLVVLCVDEARLGAKLKYEAPKSARGEAAGELFPHLYGELNVDAVVRVVELPCEVDGSFRLPDGLRD
jgi:uncharacterized protein (DUF952 family)